MTDSDFRTQLELELVRDHVSLSAARVFGHAEFGCLGLGAEVESLLKL